MNKKILLSILILSLFTINIVAAVPKIIPFVNDFADVLTPAEESTLNRVIDEIEINTTYEITVVTVTNTEGQDRLEYANKIGDANGVGKKDKDNGIVILYSLEDGGAIATGRGAEAIFNDAKVGRIGRENKHFFDEEKYYEGFMGIVQDIKEELNASLNGLNETGTNDDEDDNFQLWIILFPLFIGVLVAILSGNSNDDYYDSGVSTTGYNKRRDEEDNDEDDSRRSSSGYSSSGSSSFGSFGGGSFGGGGASF